MKKVTFDLNGDAETLFDSLEKSGMSKSTIIGKALYCLDMVIKGDYVQKQDETNSIEIGGGNPERKHGTF